MSIDTAPQAVDALKGALLEFAEKHDLEFFDSEQTHPHALMLISDAISWDEAHAMCMELNDLGYRNLYSTPSAPIYGSERDRDRLFICFNAASHPDLIVKMRKEREGEHDSKVG